jgi:hypothetical protein
MSRPIACKHERGTAASDTQPILEYGWWASNSPTAGYLMRLAADATAERCLAHGTASRIGLDVSSAAGGHSFERTEVWSDGGAFLATAELVRRHPSAGHSPDPSEERDHEH